MRSIRLLIAILFVAAGVVVGALNAQAITIDVGFAVVSATLGVALLVALLCGALLAGLVLSVSVILPLRQQVRTQRPGRVASPRPPIPDVEP
jgi:lipopolysaccharide assembly protein A